MQKNLFYSFIKMLSLITSKLLFKIEFIGRENIPVSGGLIIASNHASYFDPIFIGAGTTRPICFMARKTLFNNKIFGALIRALDSFPINRSVFDREAMDAALNLLKNGKAVFMFPEGTRTIDGNLQKAKPGIGIVAQNANVPVLPIYVHGSFNVLPKNSKMIKFVKVKLYYGKPIFLKDLNIDETLSVNDKARIIADVIMEKISELKQKIII